MEEAKEVFSIEKNNEHIDKICALLDKMLTIVNQDDISYSDFIEGCEDTGGVR
jgi:hypothetical protein